MYRGVVQVVIVIDLVMCVIRDYVHNLIEVSMKLQVEVIVRDDLVC